MEISSFQPCNTLLYIYMLRIHARHVTLQEVFSASGKYPL